MKRLSLIIAFAGLIILLLPLNTFAAGFGPDEWHQYRMNSDKNAVFDNGSDPLEFKTFKTAEEVRATPVVVGDTLFIGNHESGDVFAFDVNTGEELWHNEVPNWIHSEMIYHDGKVYVGVGNRFFQDNGIRGTGENGIFAFDAETGDLLWKYNTEGEVMPTPAYYDGAVYATTGDRHLYKLDPDSGELIHQAEIGKVISMSAPAIDDDTLFVGGSGPLPYTFSAYDLETDEFKWQEEFPDVFSGLDDVPSAVHENTVITTALEKADDGESPEHFIYALDTETGEIQWKESLGVGEMVKNNKSGAPMIYDNKVFVGSPITKTFYAYDLETGEKLWEFENEVMKAPPVAKDDIVYFSNVKGSVYALDVDSGELLGEVELEGTLAPAGPIIINDTMFIGSQDTNVYAVPLTDFTEDQDENEASAAESDENAESEESSAQDDENNGINMLIIGAVIVLLIAAFFIFNRRSKKG